MKENVFSYTQALLLAHTMAPLVIDVQGHSMWPTLRSADQIMIEATPSYRVGDILLFHDGKQLVVHRLVRTTQVGGNIYFQTKGDNRRSFDAAIGETDILGRVSAILRGNRTLPIRQPRLRYILPYAWVLSATRRRIWRD